MDAYLQPLVSCHLITIIIKQGKKDIGEMEKIEKYSQKNVYVRIVYNSFCVCLCYICVLFCVVVYVIISIFWCLAVGWRKF